MVSDYGVPDIETLPWETLALVGTAGCRGSQYPPQCRPGPRQYSSSVVYNMSTKLQHNPTNQPACSWLDKVVRLVRHCSRTPEGGDGQVAGLPAIVPVAVAPNLHSKHVNMSWEKRWKPCFSRTPVGCSARTRSTLHRPAFQGIQTAYCCHCVSSSVSSKGKTHTQTYSKFSPEYQRLGVAGKAKVEGGDYLTVFYAQASYILCWCKSILIWYCFKERIGNFKRFQLDVWIDCWNLNNIL